MHLPRDSLTTDTASLPDMNFGIQLAISTTSQRGSCPADPTITYLEKQHQTHIAPFHTFVQHHRSSTFHRRKHIFTTNTLARWIQPLLITEGRIRNTSIHFIQHHVQLHRPSRLDRRTHKTTNILISASLQQLRQTLSIASTNFSHAWVPSAPAKPAFPLAVAANERNRVITVLQLHLSAVRRHVALHTMELADAQPASPVFRQVAQCALRGG